MSSRVPRYEALLLISLVAVLLWSGIAPHDRFTWLLEVAPVLIGVPILIVTCFPASASPAWSTRWSGCTRSS